MTTLLLKNASIVATFNDNNRELKDAGVFIDDNVITKVGPACELPTTAEREIDLAGHVVLPGLVNTHHHMYQSLTRAVLMAQDSLAAPWQLIKICT